MKRVILLMLFLSTFCLTVTPQAAAQQSDEESVVQAVFFFSPTCPHCHDVINNLLMPMVDEYGDRLQILGVNVSEDQGQALYQIAIEHYQIPPNRLGVPTIIINDIVLVGSGEIPNQFPKMVEEGLAAGGIGWPGIPGLAGSVESPVEQSTDSESTVAEQVEQEPVAPTVADNQTEIAEPATQPNQEAVPASKPETAAQNPVPTTLNVDTASSLEIQSPPSPPDPVGITLAALVLIGMLAAVVYTIKIAVSNSKSLFKIHREPVDMANTWIIPVFAVIGLGVAGYLAYIEITHVEAACGPVGDCNAVQSSPYAQIFGIPIALLGIINYLGVLVLWAVYRFTGQPLTNLSLLALLALTFLGTLFSVYLTLVEIFVINAVCIWCISSAIITTLIMLFVALLLRAMPQTQRAAPA